MATTDRPRRRFVPEPIETTFSTSRSSNRSDEKKTPRTMRPNPEPTPEPSPRSPSPGLNELQKKHQQRPKRRFAPQLIESSRRSRRVGDAGPATKPTDKTDITPYTKNIYTATKHRGRRRDDAHESPSNGPRRRESEDENVVSFLLEIAAKEAERQMQEAALAAFPNSHVREGNVDHFYFRESSGSDQSPESTSPMHDHHGHPVKHHHNVRRQSSDSNLGWWHKHMQEHVEAKQEQEQQQKDDDAMAIDGPGHTGGFAATRNLARPFGYRPFGRGSPAPSFQKKRLGVTPPMLGKDLVFRRCPSPKQTKLEPDHPFAERHAEEKFRDLSGQNGLWRGYCFRSDSNDNYLVPADLHAPPMLATPRPAATPGDASKISSPPYTDEPVMIGAANGQANGIAQHRARAGPPKGLHMLHGINERLQKEKAHAELEDKIEQEFDDSFVTQVYNYLSLGYPAMARAFDGELSRISLMSIEDLERDDEKQLAQGHLVESEADKPRDQRCPRWHALQSYIKEWARQHPNLDSMDPVGWGVRERRGSWAV
ncbi:unnamed protein product [Fusarium fujikuroi]|nr:hypothetical protein CEK25_013035 [Fusarium fujikuroi]VZI13780.1 unnamed protein product [Fusarium fujikuroi]